MFSVSLFGIVIIGGISIMIIGALIEKLIETRKKRKKEK